MRAAILVESTRRSSGERDGAPDAGRELLQLLTSEPRSRERVVAVAASQRFDHAVCEALGVDERPSGVILIQCGAHAVVPDETWAELGLNPLFAESEQRADDRVEQAIARASTRFDAGAWNEAGAAYRAAEERMQHETSPRHAEVLVCLGEIERGQGRLREATALLDRALSLFPRHRGALRGRASIAQATGEHAIASAMLHRLVEGADDDEERIATLSTIASESLSAARDAMTRALAIRPGDRTLLERLGAVHEASGDWEDAVSVAVALAEGIPARGERARAFVEAADLCARKAHNTPRAVALYEAAIEDDPTAEGAFAAVEAVLVEAKDHAGVARAYERQLERLRERGADNERVGLLRKLGRLQRDVLGQPERAIRALDEVVALDPSDVEARVELALLLEAIRQPALAVRCLEIVAEQAPVRAETYRSLHRLFDRSGDRDRSYAACAALVALGEADLDEQLVYTQFAPESTLRITRGFDEDVWTELGNDHDRGIDAVLAAVEPHAIELWIEHRRRASQLTLPSERARANPQSTTVSAVKSFAWASRLLGVAEPAIYAVAEEARGGVIGVPSKAPGVVLGRWVLSGRSVAELSFIAAHHLTYYRPGWRVSMFYPELMELHALVLAAMGLGIPKLAARWSSAGILSIREGLARKLDGAAQARLAEIVGQVAARGGELDLKLWMRSVETIACRAALLASGDITVAGNLLAIAGRPIVGMSAADRARDLLAFSVSQRYAALRQLIGVTV